jgi:adenylate cyclase
MGRYQEAQQCWERMLAIEGSGLVDPAVQIIVHLGQVEHAWWTNDVALAKAHAGHLAILSGQHAIPYLRTVNANCQGMARSLAQDFAGALSAFSEAIGLVRSANVGAEYETEILASLAECHRRNGEFALAQAVAKEAIEISRQRSTRLAECRALITLGASMIDDPGAKGLDQAVELFARAESLIRETGAAIYEAALLFERSRLPGPTRRISTGERSA